jgi:hypothetical protein
MRTFWCAQAKARLRDYGFVLMSKMVGVVA